MHNCKDDLSDGEDDQSVMATDLASVRTGNTKHSYASKTTKKSHASRNFATKIINRIELSNHDME